MLVASRDPYHGTHEVPSPPNAGGRIARTMSLLQVVGTVLAIPVGLGSAYSMYKANFTAEASCQSLRANIIQILDKGVDASARHMLVRRDVEAFEKTCGGVDPDAAAAFKTLLAVDRQVATVAPAPVRRIETQAKPVDKPVERKADTKADVKVEPKAEAKVETKQVPAKAVAVATAPAQRDAATSDAEWLEAVRGALVARSADAAPAAEVVERKTEPKLAEPKLAEPKPLESKALEAKISESKPAEEKTAIVAPLVRQAVREAPPMSIENVRVPPLATVAAPLPPPSEVASAPAPVPQLEKVRVDDSHPVPPGAIPEQAAADTPPESRSRIGQLISEIPFAKRLLDR
jgi:hypothetical protein